MARTMRFWKPVRFGGVTYLPGQVASFSDADAATLEAAGDAIDSGGVPVTAAPDAWDPTAVGSDADVDDASAWVAPVLAGAWAVSGGRTPEYAKTRGGQVLLRGAATTGAAGAVFTLPAGFRPGVAMEFPVIGLAGDKVSIATNGVVTTNVVGSTPAVCVFDGIAFRAEG